ncbi:MAG: heme exporter protein CcmD [Betaproteobacteria bacterium]|jgi:heme exporter protein D
MIWNSFSDFISMHGYGPYVWGSFGLTLALLVIEVIQLRLQRKKLIAMSDLT